LSFELIQHSKLRTQNFKERLTIDQKARWLKSLRAFLLLTQQTQATQVTQATQETPVTQVTQVTQM